MTFELSKRDFVRFGSASVVMGVGMSSPAHASTVPLLPDVWPVETGQNVLTAYQSVIDVIAERYTSRFIAGPEFDRDRPFESPCGEPYKEVTSCLALHDEGASLTAHGSARIAVETWVRMLEHMHIPGARFIYWRVKPEIDSADAIQLWPLRIGEDQPHEVLGKMASYGTLKGYIDQVKFPTYRIYSRFLVTDQAPV